MSERLKEPVLKTGDVRASVGSNPTLSSTFLNIVVSKHASDNRFGSVGRVCVLFMEKYSRGRRGAPAKGVGRVTGARVQIPPFPPKILCTFFVQSIFIEKKK